MSKNIKIEIKHRLFGSVLFEYECENNTMRKTVEEAARQHRNLCDANLRDANLRDANLRDADLCGADLCGANLCDANLRDADLCGADLCGANLRDADLCGANLRDADLCGANLCGANLCGANLRDADLCGANLCDANLRDADLCGCVLDYNDDYDGYGSTDELISKINKNSDLRPTVVYENHDAFSSRWGMFWRNLIILREWEVETKPSNLHNALNDDQKAVLRAFAKVNNTNKFIFRDLDDEGCEFVIERYNGGSCVLGLSARISDLVCGAEYSLEDLGIEL